MPITRDQQRAVFAYESVGQVPQNLHQDYRTLVNGLGANIMKSGLAGTMSYIQRYHNGSASNLLLTHLANAGIPGVPAHSNGADLPSRFRGMQLQDYILASREILKIALWLKRALQAQD